VPVFLEPAPVHGGLPGGQRPEVVIVGEIGERQLEQGGIADLRLGRVLVGQPACQLRPAGGGDREDPPPPSGRLGRLL
jgi:hypothetical protein